MIDGAYVASDADINEAVHRAERRWQTFPNTTGHGKRETYERRPATTDVVLWKSLISPDNDLTAVVRRRSRQMRRPVCRQLFLTRVPVQYRKRISHQLSVLVTHPKKYDRANASVQILVGCDNFFIRVHNAFYDQLDGDIRNLWILFFSNGIQKV